MSEGMSAGPMPIVSALDTVRPLVENERNVLLARDLEPEEIELAPCLTPVWSRGPQSGILS